MTESSQGVGSVRTPEQTFETRREPTPMKTTRKREIRRMVAACAVLTWCGAARADYASMTGAIELISPPASLKPNQVQNDQFINTFAEHHELTLASAVNVDDTAAGTFNKVSSLVAGTIAAGTVVDSYIFHSDTTKSSTVYEGSVTFSSAILGVIVLSSSLNATDAQLGDSGTIYPTGDSGRGLELSKTQDFFTLSADLKTLTFHFDTHGNVDEVRVLTVGTPVPEPAAAVLLGLGGLGALGVARLHLRRATARGR